MPTITTPPTLASKPAILGARAKFNPPALASKPKIVIQTGRVQSPIKMLLYGEKGVGKSTLLNQSDRPIVASAEQGHDELGTPRVECENWETLVGTVDWLIDSPHDYGTFGIDTLDWAEQLLHEYIQRTKNITNLADSYGAGYKEALSEWRLLVARMEKLRTKRDMKIMLLAHMEAKRIDNPMGHDFTKYQPKLRERAYALLAEWVGFLGFCAHKTVVSKADKQASAKATGLGVRVIYTEQRGGFDAKNRYRMPPEIDLSWSSIMTNSKTVFEDRNSRASMLECGELREQIHALLPQLPEEKAKAMIEWLGDPAGTDPGPDAGELRVALNRIQVLVAQADESAPAGDETTEPPEDQPTE